MKLSFTQKEYARLLEMAYLAMWVAGAHHVEETPATRRYVELEKKLLELATPLGCADYVQGDPDGGSLTPSNRLSDEPAVRKAIDDFEDATFWDELASRLAERDYAREIQKNPLPANMDDEKRREHLLNRVCEIEERYWAEFEKNGIDNLVTLFGTDKLS